MLIFFFSFYLQLFKEDPDTGLTHVALSSDSTCINHLYSSQDGYETLHLEKLEPTPPTTPTTSAEIVPEVPAEATCSFPEFWLMLVSPAVIQVSLTPHVEVVINEQQ